jgi:hypothetical protein
MLAGSFHVGIALNCRLGLGLRDVEQRHRRRRLVGDALLALRSMMTI